MILICEKSFGKQIIQRHKQKFIEYTWLLIVYLKMVISKFLTQETKSVINEFFTIESKKTVINGFLTDGTKTIANILDSLFK